MARQKAASKATAPAPPAQSPTEEGDKIQGLITTAIEGATANRAVSGIGTELGTLENIRDGHAQGVISEEDIAFVELIVSRIDALNSSYAG